MQHNNILYNMGELFFSFPECLAILKTKPDMFKLKYCLKCGYKKAMLLFNGNKIK